jgi:hypothetical protein
MAMEVDQSMLAQLNQSGQWLPIVYEPYGATGRNQLAKRFA